MQYYTGFVGHNILASSSAVLEKCFFSDLTNGVIEINNSQISINISLTCFIDIANDDFGGCLKSYAPNSNLKIKIINTLFRGCFTYSNEGKTTEGQTVSVRCDHGENFLQFSHVSMSFCGRANDPYDRRSIVDATGVFTHFFNLNISDSWLDRQLLYIGSEVYNGSLNAKYLTMTRLFSKHTLYFFNSSANFSFCNMHEINSTDLLFVFHHTNAIFCECCIISKYKQTIGSFESNVNLDSCYVVNVVFPMTDPSPQKSYKEIENHILVGDVMKELLKKPKNIFWYKTSLILALNLFYVFLFFKLATVQQCMKFLTGNNQYKIFFKILTR